MVGSGAENSERGTGRVGECEDANRVVLGVSLCTCPHAPRLR